MVHGQRRAERPFRLSHVPAGEKHHLDPPPPRPAAAIADADSALSADDLWERKLHRHHLGGALGFAATYGAAAAAGGVFTGLVLELIERIPDRTAVRI